MTGAWPYPGDSPLVIARRVALAYRSRLADVDPTGCAALDGLVGGQWGQGWAVPSLLTFDLDDLLDRAQAAELGSVTAKAIDVARRRGRLSGELHGGQWRYRAGDVLALSAAPRRRTRGDP